MGSGFVILTCSYFRNGKIWVTDINGAFFQHQGMRTFFGHCAGEQEAEGKNKETTYRFRNHSF
jgi:hypothetical protein